MNRSGRLTLLACCWLGAALRFRGLFANSFHADEALFAGWARLIAVWRDPLLLSQAVDKPPLLFYLQALFYPFFGPVEWAARLPSLIASLLLIPLTAQLARRLTGDRTAALIAAALIAIAPLAIQFSATAFSDPLLAFWLVAALYCIAGGRSEQGVGSFLAGLFFGLALATKYQALLFAPLWLGIAWSSGWRRADWIRSLAGLVAALGLVIAWLWVRATGEGVVVQQWLNIGGIRPAHSWELWPRAVQTVTLWRYALGWPLLVASAGGLLLLLVSGRQRPTQPTPLILVTLFVIGYVWLHWLWAVPVWDRYLLPIMPLVAVLLGKVFSNWGSSECTLPVKKLAFAGLAAAVVLAQLPVALSAREGRYPIGGRPEADGGAAEVALLLKDAPYGAVLYDHWYSWHWQYQFFDRRVYVSWFPHAEGLLNDLAVFAGDGSPRYIALPSSAMARPVVRKLRDAGYGLARLDGQDENATMTLYRITLGTAE